MAGVNLHGTVIEAAPELWTEQETLVGFNGVPPLTQEAVLEKSCTGRVQRNLNLGGNTDMEIRPKLVIYQLRAFCFGNFNNQQFYNYNIMYGLCHIGCAWKRGKK